MVFRVRTRKLSSRLLLLAGFMNPDCPVSTDCKHTQWVNLCSSAVEPSAAPSTPLTWGGSYHFFFLWRQNACLPCWMFTALMTWLVRHQCDSVSSPLVGEQLVQQVAPMTHTGVELCYSETLKEKCASQRHVVSSVCSLQLYFTPRGHHSANMSGYHTFLNPLMNI